MKRHDESLLWQYAARELDTEEAALVGHHLSECVDCRERLLDVRQARLVLQDAQTPRPKVQWSKVDQGISQLVEARLLRQARAARIGWRLPLAFAVAAAAVLVVAFKVELPRPVEPVVALAPAPVVPVPVGSEVEQALGLSRVAAELSLALQGERVEAGEVLRTAVGGRGLLTLPDGSRMRLAGGSQLALTRAEADDVALTLERGRVGVQASHRPRRGFVVHAAGLSVRVVGTLFTVSQVAGMVEVAVAEGKVQVEPPEGEPLLLLGGERVRFERGSWRPLKGKATHAQIAELEQLTAPPMIEAAGTPRVPAGGLMPPGALARREDSAARQPSARQPAAQPARVVGVAMTPEPFPAQNEALLPRKPAVAQGQPTVWPAPAAQPIAEAPPPQLEEKASVWPTMGGGPTTYEPRVYQPGRQASAPASAPAAAQPAGAPISGGYQLEVEAPIKANEPPVFNGWPKEAGNDLSSPDSAPVAVPPSAPETAAPQATVAPANAAPSAAGSPGKPPKPNRAGLPPPDLETLFLERAERGLERGICERYLLGLQELAADASRNDRAELARILRARCYDARVRPDLSEIEYRRYLEVWPRGRYADEARKAALE